MSDIELVIKKSKLFERLLETQFLAQGKGLHQKLNSVQHRLPDPLIRKLRFVATIRNRLVHEHCIDSLEDRWRFERTCNEAELQLRSLFAHRPLVSDGQTAEPNLVIPDCRPHRTWRVLWIAAAAAVYFLLGISS